MSNNTALVVGDHGVIGRSVAEHLAARPNWSVVGLSRRGAGTAAGIRHISVDLLDRKDCQQKLRDLGQITHVIFAACIERPTALELVETNLALLQNFWDAMEPFADTLKHVTLYQGGQGVWLPLRTVQNPGSGERS